MTFVKILELPNRARAYLAQHLKAYLCIIMKQVALCYLPILVRSAIG